jgi:hypothetical protein
LPFDHVARGNVLDTHFLSTTTNFTWVMYYWCKQLVETARPITSCPWVIGVDPTLPDAPRLITHDMRNFAIANQFRARFGTSADEVLIEKHIPLSHITHVFDFQRSDRALNLLQFTKIYCLVHKPRGPSVKSYKEWLSDCMQRSPFKDEFPHAFAARVQADSKMQAIDYARDEDEDTVNEEEAPVAAAAAANGPAAEKQRTSTSFVARKPGTSQAPSASAAAASVVAVASAPAAATNTYASVVGSFPPSLQSTATAAAVKTAAAATAMRPTAIAIAISVSLMMSPLWRVARSRPPCRRRRRANSKPNVRPVLARKPSSNVSASDTTTSNTS